MVRTSALIKEQKKLKAGAPSNGPKKTIVSGKVSGSRNSRVVAKHKMRFAWGVSSAATKCGIDVERAQALTRWDRVTCKNCLRVK